MYDGQTYEVMFVNEYKERKPFLIVSARQWVALLFLSPLTLAVLTASVIFD